MEVAVIGRMDERWGQVPVAVVTPRPGAEVTLASLLTHLDGRIASFKMPKDLVLAQGLPRNAGGKVLKGALHKDDVAGSDDG